MAKTPNPSDQNIDIDSEKKVKYPFSGIAPNLIDKFLVLGYDQKVIDNFMLFGAEDEETDYQSRLKVFLFDERPTIINEICNDYSKDLLENDLILELIFPNIPKIFFLDKEDANKKKEPDEELLTSTYSIIFSINPQDNSGSKKSYNGLGYIFYVQIEYKNEMKSGTLFVPIAYVILSEFPYFYHFKELCKHIVRQMKQETDGIPLEILIYNIVKYLQSPINKSINLTFVAPLGLPFKDKGNNLSEILNPMYSLSREDNNRIPSMFFHQLSGYPFMDINLSFLFNLIPPEIVVEVFIFAFLEHDIIFYSQRPEILNMIMYIFSNLNYPFNDSIYYWHVLSVSQDSFMFGTSTFVGKTCSTLTGILSEYDSNVLTTSKIREHFVLDIDNKNFFFLYQEETDDVKDTISLYTYIKNCAQDAEDSTNDAIKVDQETKKKNYFNDGMQLYDVIKNLMDELNRRSKKVTSTNYNEKKEKPSFLTLYEDESEMECFEANLRLQKAFFTFIAQIIQNFVSILSIEGAKTEGDVNISVNIRKEDDDINEEEQNKRKLASKAGRIFKKKFIDCSKYSSFVINFCKYHDTIDLYKIPYTFINEFIYYSHVAVGNNLSEVDVFKLIDQFYGKRKLVSFEEIIKDNNMTNEKKDKEKKNKKEKKKDKEEKDLMKEAPKEDLVDEVDIQNIYTFNFINFVEYYKENLRALINREQEDDREIFTKTNTRGFKTYKRNGFFLSDKILNLYMTISNNNYEKFLKIFDLIKCVKNVDENNKINENKIVNINGQNEIESRNILEEIAMNKNMNKLERDLRIFGSYEFIEITDVIERHFILERCFTSYGLIKFSLLNILAITRGFTNQKISNPKVIETICDFCEKTKSLARKYMNIFLKILQELNFNNTIKNKKEFLKCRNLIALYFTKSNMLPTEETTKVFNEKQKGETNKVTPGKDEDEIKEDIDINVGENKEEEKFIKENGLPFEDKLLKNVKKFDIKEILKIIDTIFTGNYTQKSKINAITYKDLNTSYNKKGVKSKDSFIPKTPLNLYYSTISLLNKFINNNFKNNKDNYDDILTNILSLLFYFKIPTGFIVEKWIEHYHRQDIANINDLKTQLKRPISVFIAILVNLIDVIQKDLKN